ncbi:MAG: hypothetical protein JWR00_3772 [Rubritepida sp.]|nr:hypothetical protein [Rubritepida sp.]
MSGGAGQAPEQGGSCVMQVNRSFGRDLVPCAGLRRLLATPAARIGTFDDLRLRQTSTLLVLAPPKGGAQDGPVIADACPVCGVRLVG